MSTHSPPSQQPQSTEGNVSPVAFAYVERSATLVDKVTALIRDRIVDGQLRPGDRLASERDLGDQFGVSRTVVREAVRALAAKGLIEPSKRGYRVTRVQAGAVSESMTLFLQGRPLNYEQIHEVRTTIEIAVARLAAERATEEDVAAMVAQCDAMRDATELDDIAAADLEFHRTVAVAAHNELFLVVLDSIHDVLLDLRRATLGMPARIAKGVRAHRRIAKCIAASDTEGTVRAMSEHLNDSLRAWTALQHKADDE